MARLKEARLRRAGSRNYPPAAGGVFDAADLPTISARNVCAAVHNPEQLAATEAVELAEPVTVWMKLDTSMHRLSVRPSERRRRSTSV